MEFSECREWWRFFFLAGWAGTLIVFTLCTRPVDVAAREADPHRRIAFVAAFAMSNYSSTIGRIAKPFNPMLVSIFPSVSLELMS